MLHQTSRLTPRLQAKSSVSKLFSTSSSILQSLTAENVQPSALEVDDVKPSSLRIKNPRMRRAILQGYKDFSGPPSLKSRTSRVRYSTPVGLDDAFSLGYSIVQKRRQNLYLKAAELQKQIDSSSNEQTELIDSLKAQLEKTLIDAELDNPEVQYNFKIGQIDWSQPVYRHLAKKEWESYDLLVLMQRLESLAVIPDTESTLDPKVQVKLQWPGFINKWITPGTVLPSAVCSRPPHLVIQEFENVPQDSLYTVLIVDPDTPDTPNDCYKTTLHWAVSNIPLSLSNAIVDIDRSDELFSYIPPVPEKNTGSHRYAVWVYRQDGRIDKNTVSSVTREDFNIRDFSSQLNLTAVGAHVWRSHFDRTTESVREKYGMEPGRIFSRIRR